MAELAPPEPEPRLSTSSTSSAHSLNLPSLQPLSHTHPLLSAPDFDPDAFLLSRIHIPLEELRGELREYLGQLREELVQLINDDYEEFLSLGTGLRGEEERLRMLSGPLLSVRSEVESVRDVLAEHQQKVQSKLDERASLRSEKALLDLLQRLFDTLSRAEALLDQPHHDEQGKGKLVGRVASEYTQVVYLLNKAKAEGCAIVDVVQERISKIKKRISDDLSTVLVTELQNQDKAGLKHCLRIYELIEGWEEAEEVIRKDFQLYCRDAISTQALNPPTTPTVPLTPHPLQNSLTSLRLPPKFSSPLALLYNQLLTRVAIYQPLMDVGEEVSSKFGFFARVIWPEIGERIMEKLGGVIFAAGRPDELHRHLTTTYKFLELLESIAPSVRSVKTMRQSQTYLTFERRWQLPVYFQLRWKEIVSGVEQALTGQPSYTSKEKESEWALGQSEKVWKGVESCWREDVYVAELAPRFWRLTLQIVSRYGTYLKSTLDSYVITEENTSQEDTALRFAAAAIIDLEQIGARVRELQVVKELDLADHLKPSTSLYISKIESILIRRCLDPLKLIRSIASQFRASTPNPTAPSQASYYVPSVLKPLRAVYGQRPELKERHSEELGGRVVDEVLKNFASTLASVKKTEDLLRKHRKSKKTTGFSSFFGGGATAEEGKGEEGEKEEERFAAQMKVDIKALREDAESLGVEVEGMESWKELVGVCEGTVN
ncbi:hypothetical protein B9479_006485 [Cryptococcus floricola]|uniref:Conserved oligomeric Golgi complex subunit 2 n=1 Tax=Cryptococcus floricola TaxID=2591691 RepID=A0A5D3AN16_9TREE|nr:hypothetical protein B9479_006485 [Cryptococcus floricola]